VAREPLECAVPEELGLSGTRLADLMGQLEEKYIRSGLLPGAIFAVVRRGKLVAYREWGDLRKSTVLKLYSISKVFTALAALQLVDEGIFGLEDPISTLVPEWPERLEVEREDGAVVRAEQVLTVRHCLSHTGGFTYEMPSVHPAHAQRAPELRRLAARRRGPAAPPRELRDLVKAARSQPLLFEPGEHFNYGGLGICLLARAVEEASGLSIAEYMSRRLFGPMGMRDTGFVIDEARAGDCVSVKCHPSTVPAMAAMLPNGAWRSRLKLYARAWLAFLFRWPFLEHTPAGNGVLSPKKLWDRSLSLFVPDAGVVSTGADVVRWLSILTRGGQGPDASGRMMPVFPAASLSAISTPATPELESPFALDAPPPSAQLFAANEARAAPARGTRPQNGLPGQRFGHGACVVTAPARAGLPPRAEGSWHWMGFASTYFFANPREELAACFLTQLISHRTYPIHHELIDGVHKCLE